MNNELYEDSYENQNHFSFGKNWQNFLKTLNNEKIKEAKKSLTDFLGGEENIKGKTFVDIGCGSGLFSLAALRLGASRIVSVDIDNASVACVKYLYKKEGAPKQWDIQTGSALNKEFINTLGAFDIVYSWGVLHHTGNMYQALENVTSLVNNKGNLYIALYNDNQRIMEGSSSFWLSVKKLYNLSPWLVKKVMETIYTAYYITGLILNGKNPITYIQNYQSLRGMNFMTDIKDWLGGYPYEYASIEKIVSFYDNLGFRCNKTNPARSIGCNEFLIKKNIH